MFRQIDVNYTLYRSHYDYNAKNYSYTLYNNFNTEDTYVCIFSPYQETYLNMLLKEPSIKIIFKSEKAINTNHSGGPRNTLVVFEWLGNTLQDTNPAQDVGKTEKILEGTI